MIMRSEDEIRGMLPKISSEHAKCLLEWCLGKAINTDVALWNLSQVEGRSNLYGEMNSRYHRMQEDLHRAEDGLDALRHQVPSHSFGQWVCLFETWTYINMFGLNLAIAPHEDIPDSWFVYIGPDKEHTHILMDEKLTLPQVKTLALDFFATYVRTHIT